MSACWGRPIILAAIITTKTLTDVAACILQRRSRMSRFKPGVSGNPKGRARGAKNASTKLRDAIAEGLPRIIATLRDSALAGDVQAASLLLSRCLPPLRPESSAQSIAAAGGSLGERAEAIVTAAVSGQLPTNAAAELMNVLNGQSKILETVELERRIAALEARNETE